MLVKKTDECIALLTKEVNKLTVYVGRKTIKAEDDLMAAEKS